MGCGASTKKYEAPKEETKSDATETKTVDKVAEANAARTTEDAAKSDPKPAAADDDEEEEDEEDVMDEAQFEAEMKKRQEQQAKGDGKRKGVSAEGTQADENWKPPVFEKSAEQVARLRQSLSKCFMFACLDEEQFGPVLAAFMETPAKAGDTVISQGAEVGSSEPGLFVIEDGQLSVYKTGIEKSVFTYTVPGQYFGDLALLYNAPRAATVKADVDSMLWSIDRDTFNYMVKDAARNSIERRMGFLQSVPLLSGLTKDEMATICDALQARSIAAGSQIITKGEVGHEMFIVEVGKCEARIDGNVVASYEAKNFFGELALLKEAPRAADVFATEDSRILGLGAEAFKRLLGPLDDLLQARASSYENVVVPS